MRLQNCRNAGLIKRMGVVVRHRALGYRANAMVVWDVPDNELERVGRVAGGRDLRDLVLPATATAAGAGRITCSA